MDVVGKGAVVGDIAPDKAMIGGSTCDEAYQAAIATFDEYIAMYRGNGDHEDAASPETNRDRLVGPSADSCFGDKDAHLGAPGAVGRAGGACSPPGRAR
jgi:hypothetical protein